MNEEMQMLKHIGAAILLTMGQDRVITDMFNLSPILHECYPSGTRCFLVTSKSIEGATCYDSVYWRNGRCVVVSEKEVWHTKRSSIIEGLIAEVER